MRIALDDRLVAASEGVPGLLTRYRISAGGLRLLRPDRQLAALGGDDRR
jgi:hypothetical protein